VGRRQQTSAIARSSGSTQIVKGAWALYVKQPLGQRLPFLSCAPSQTIDAPSARLIPPIRTTL
jgi:hypothetical protein